MSFSERFSIFTRAFVTSKNVLKIMQKSGDFAEIWLTGLKCTLFLCTYHEL